ncbi:MAG: hypothetical protein CMP25_01825 [Rickettsiales bacterium]|nr:hypothetical protein [Rickettsiales bacterium]
MQEKIFKVKNSINNFIEIAEKEKQSLKDSIEMLWLNADVQRKKIEIIIPESADENILRIRQLLAAAWSEDYKSD